MAEAPRQAADRPRLHRDAEGRRGRPDLCRRALLHAAALHRDLKGVDRDPGASRFDATVTNRPGARFGPQAIRRASAIFDSDPQYPFGRDLFERAGGRRLRRLPARPAQPADDPGDDRARGAKRSSKPTCILLSLGGDHFVTWPLLKAHAANHGPLALVQFDAHQDTWADDGKRIDHGSFVGARRARGHHRSRPLDPDRHPHPCAGGLRHQDPLRPRGRGDARRPTSPTRSSSAPAARRPI